MVFSFSWLFISILSRKLVRMLFLKCISPLVLSDKSISAHTSVSACCPEERCHDSLSHVRISAHPEIRPDYDFVFLDFARSFFSFSFCVKSFIILSSPSLRLVNSITSSVLIVVRPAWAAKASRSTATLAAWCES